MRQPPIPKIYHIVHVNRLPSIVECDCLWCDKKVVQQQLPGSTIGLNTIKSRRLHELTLRSYPDLYVGDCVPFYFCPRSIMLYMIYQANSPELIYKEGQESIIHLEANLYDVVNWANENHIRWAFTTSNAGSRYFDDFNTLSKLSEINWDAVYTRNWGDCKLGKQAEFLIEHSFPWFLVSFIGVYSAKIFQEVQKILVKSSHIPIIEIKQEWYY